MQRFQVIGNICNDLSLEEYASGKKVLKFGIAVRRDYVRGDSDKNADFFSCIAWSGTAETIARYCKKGDKIYLDGKIETRSYEDNKGIKRNAIDFIIDKMEFLGNKKERTEESEESNYRIERKQKPTLCEDDSDAEIPF